MFLVSSIFVRLIKQERTFHYIIPDICKDHDPFIVRGYEKLLVLLRYCLLHSFFKRLLFFLVDQNAMTCFVSDSYICFRVTSSHIENLTDLSIPINNFFVLCDNYSIMVDSEKVMEYFEQLALAFLRLKLFSVSLVNSPWESVDGYYGCEIEENKSEPAIQIMIPKESSQSKIYPRNHQWKE